MRVNNRNVLVFSVALNGYQWLYRPMFKSHREYADRYGYTYQLVSRPFDSLLGLEVAWLKVFLLKSALECGYDWVLFVDADAIISKSMPCIESVYRPHRSVYMANGYSGEINSGVIIVRNTGQALAFIDDVLDIRFQDIQEKSLVNWGENGYVIHVAKKSTAVEIIEKKWNNNEILEMEDYIRHYSAGPLRSRYKPTFSNKLCYVLSHYSLALKRRIRNLVLRTKVDIPSNEIVVLHKKVLMQYPVFCNRTTRAEPYYDNEC